MYTNNQEAQKLVSNGNSSVNFENQDGISMTEEELSGNSGMQKLILKVNQMQEVCAQLGTTMQFDLTQIAVIGAQSLGKSSVLENIVGRYI